MLLSLKSVTRALLVTAVGEGAVGRDPSVGIGVDSSVLDMAGPSWAEPKMYGRKL